MIGLRGVVVVKPRGLFQNGTGRLVVLRRSKASPAFENKAAVEAAARKHAAETTTTATTTTTSGTNTTGRSSTPILAALAAATAGIGVVATAAQVVDRSMTVPPFDPHHQRFDQSTFTGRFARMLLQCDPTLLLYGDRQIRRAQEQLAGWKAGGASSSMTTTTTDHELWTAKRLVESAVNDQNKIIPQCFRMSGYVPYNGPVSIAMISASSTPALLFWSWVNQSQNALVNVYNAAGDGMDNTTLAKSYAGAVSAALLVSYGLATFVQRRYNAETARRLMRYVAFPSAMVASSLNCYIVRSPEIGSGIPVYDRRSGDVVGISQVAAARGVYATTASRALLQLPVYFLPPALLSLVQLSPTMILPATTFFLLVSFGIGLPAAIAVFPQECAIDVKELEVELQQRVDPATNAPYRTLYYNKGL